MNSNLTNRLWEKDTTLWTNNADIQKQITNRLGWLDAPLDFGERIEDILNFEKQCTFSHIVLLGMGGSSLISEVFLQALETPKRSFHTVDTTDAAFIGDLIKKIPLDDTLFIVASKSGNTLEVQSLFSYFWHLTPNPKQFIAITDPETKLAKLAQEKNFLKAWINPPDIGGRFSALSYFGLVPLALMGGDLKSFWGRLAETLSLFKEEDNPAMGLASQMFQAHQEGVHKLTLQATQALEALPLWVEQLIAESTGKEDKGFLPMIQSHGVTPFEGSYIHAFGFEDELDEDMFVHSVSVMNDFSDLAPEIFLWEMTTALLGSMMQINPFSEPHVNSTKEKTSFYLNKENPSQDIQKQIQKIGMSDKAVEKFVEENSDKTVCILSYLPQNEEGQKLLTTFKDSIQTKNVTVSIGPRYLHSTGQFHKGGKDIACYIILTQNQESPTVPNQPYNFNTLKQAQALGDYEALVSAKRNVIIVNERT